MMMEGGEYPFRALFIQVGIVEWRLNVCPNDLDAVEKAPQVFWGSQPPPPPTASHRFQCQSDYTRKHIVCNAHGTAGRQADRHRLHSRAKGVPCLGHYHNGSEHQKPSHIDSAFADHKIATTILLCPWTPLSDVLVQFGQCGDTLTMQCL